jgi:serine protease Do
MRLGVFLIHWVVTIILLWLYHVLISTWVIFLWNHWDTASTWTVVSFPKVQYDFFAFQDALVQTVDKNKSSVVNIMATKDYAYYFSNNPWSIWWWWWDDTQILTGSKNIWWWSGIYVYSEQQWDEFYHYFLTNKHIVADSQATYSLIFDDGKNIEAQQIRWDPVIDIAILLYKSDSTLDYPQASINSINDPVSVWQFVIAIGNALAEYRHSVSFGIISGRNRQLWAQDGSTYIWLYQTDAALSQGNSWWPLFDLNGNVIWINTAISAFGTNIWFSIPITRELVYASIKSITTNDAIIRPLLWVLYRDIFDGNGVSWIEIIEILDSSYASRIWLMHWDFITHINGIAINDAYPFLYLWYSLAQTWWKISLEIRRDTEVKMFDFYLD